MDIINKVVQPLFKRLTRAEFDFSNLDSYEFDVEGEFDVYNIETESSLPKIDWDAIEAQLEEEEQKLQWSFTQNPILTKEEDDIIDRFIQVIQVEEDSEYAQSTFYNHPQRRRADREEIRRKLAMGTDEELADDDVKKSSLQSRMKNGKNLQICFMNETASDCESQCSDTESTQGRIDENERIPNTKKGTSEKNFVSEQRRLQSEARFALAQAKEMAKMQMKIEKQNQLKSPIAEIVRGSFNKIGFPFPSNKRRMSRQILTDMNVAQLQVIVNDFHSQIEKYNEYLVELLLTRDDLHMEQDSMLVDIEDLTKHLNAKQQAIEASSPASAASSKTSTEKSETGLKNSIASKAVKLKTFVQK